MTYDPAWDMPQPNWVQQGSFEAGAIPPAVAPNAGTPVCIGPVAVEWLPYVQGALDQLRNPSSWIVADDTALATTLQRVDELRSIIGMATGCCDVAIRLTAGCVLQYSIDGGATWTDVTGWAANFAACVKQATIPDVPLLPPGADTAQRGCNIAGYLATSIVKAAIQEAITAYNTNLSLLQFAVQVTSSILAFEFPWTTAFVYAVYDLYQAVSSSTIADFTAAASDGTLWANVTCAIYNAIKADGKVTRANFSSMLAAVCGVTYAHPEVVTAICTYLTDLGVDQVLGLQVGGALDTVDCSGCGGTWCYEWNFSGSQAMGWAVPAGGYGGNLCAYGWCGTEVNAGTPNDYTGVDIVHSFPAHYVVDIAIFAEARTGQGGAARDVCAYHAGALVFVYHIPLGGTTAVGGQAIGIPGVNQMIDKIQVSWRSFGPPVLGATQVKAVKVEGTGPNPFGADNCTF